MKSESARWLALFTCYFMFISNGFLFFFVPPLLPMIRADIPMDDLAVGWLQGVYAIPAVLLALALGSLLDRWDTRRAGIAAALLMIGGNVVFNLGGHYGLMCAARLVVGIGCILINLVAAKMVTIWFRKKQRGLALSVLHTAWPLGAIIAFSTFHGFGQALGWQGTTLALNIFIAATVLAFILFAPRHPGEAEDRARVIAERRTQQKSPGLLREFLFPKDLWLTAFSWLCFNLSMASLLTFGAEFFSSRGFDYGAASFIVGLIMWTAAPGSLLAGWMIDRFAAIKTYIVVPGIIVAACLMGLQTQIHPAAFILVAGLMASFLPVATYAIPGQVVEPARLGVAFGVILTFSNLGNVVGPVVVGWINTATVTREPGVLFMAFAFALCALFGVALGGHRLAAKKKIDEQ